MGCQFGSFQIASTGIVTFISKKISFNQPPDIHLSTRHFYPSARKTHISSDFPWLLSCLFQCSKWHPTPVLLPGKSHGWRSLVCCSPWARHESDTTERLHFHFSLSCIGEGNGNLLQCSCLENPRDGGAWWAAGYGVAQSQTRLKQLSSSSKLIFRQPLVNSK